MKRLFVVSGGLFVLFFLALLSLLFSSAPKKQEIPPAVPTPTPVLAQNQANQINYSLLFTDKTVAQEMSQKLATPDTASTSGDFNIFSYKTGVPQRNNELYLKGNTASYFVEEATTDNTYYTDFLTKNPGEIPQIVYDPTFINSGLAWYVFPDQGVAFLADNTTGYATKILYFPQTSFQNFLQTAAKTFSLTTTDPSTNDEGEGVQGYQP